MGVWRHFGIWSLEPGNGTLILKSPWFRKNCSPANQIPPLYSNSFPFVILSLTLHFRMFHRLHWSLGQCAAKRVCEAGLFGLFRMICSSRRDKGRLLEAKWRRRQICLSICFRSPSCRQKPRSGKEGKGKVLKEGERIKQGLCNFKIENNWCGLFTQIYLKIR